MPNFQIVDIRDNSVIDLSLPNTFPLFDDGAGTTTLADIAALEAHLQSNVATDVTYDAGTNSFTTSQSVPNQQFVPSFHLWSIPPAASQGQFPVTNNNGANGDGPTNVVTADMSSRASTNLGIIQQLEIFSDGGPIPNLGFGSTSVNFTNVIGSRTNVTISDNVILTVGRGTLEVLSIVSGVGGNVSGTVQPVITRLQGDVASFTGLTEVATDQFVPASPGTNGTIRFNALETPIEFELSSASGATIPDTIQFANIVTGSIEVVQTANGWTDLDNRSTAYNAASVNSFPVDISGGTANPPELPPVASVQSAAGTVVCKSIVRNQSTTITIPLLNSASDSYLNNSTVVDGDVSISINGSGFVLPTNSPTMIPGSAVCRIELTATETNVDEVIVRYLDLDGEWTESYVICRTDQLTASRISNQIAVDWEGRGNSWEDGLETLTDIMSASLSARWTAGQDSWPAVNSVISNQIAVEWEGLSNGWEDAFDTLGNTLSVARTTDLPANFADLSISATTGLVMVAGGTGGTVDLDPVLTAIASIPTTDLERADGPLLGLVADVSRIKKIGEAIRHTRSDGNTDVTTETRV